jgi:hypothetical protein
MLSGKEVTMELARVSWLAAALATAAPLSAQVIEMPKVEVEFDQETNFAALKSYRWAGGVDPDENPTVRSLVTWYVDRGLEPKGLKKATGDVDVEVHYEVEAKSELKGTPNQPGPDAAGRTAGSGPSNSVSFRKQTHGSLALELRRASDDHLLWRAATPWASVDKAKVDDEVRGAVRLLLSKYPPKAVPKAP